MKAKETTGCTKCPEDIVSGQDIVPAADGWMHRACAPGQDDQGPIRKAAKRAEQGTVVRGPKSAAKAQQVTEDLNDLSGYREVLNGAAADMANLYLAGAAGTAVPATVMKIPEKPHGLIYNLDEPTYHAHPTSLSVSGAKVLRHSPEQYDYDRTHPVFKREFDYGSAAHKYVLGTGPEIVELERFDPKTGASVGLAKNFNSPSTTAHRDRVRAEGKVGMLARDHASVQAMAEKIKTHRLAAKLLEQGEPEVSAFATDDDTGVLMRGRFDWFRKRVGVDYKTSVTSDPTMLSKIVYTNGWYMQAAWYTYLAELCGYDLERFYFIVQQKTAPYTVTVVLLTYPALQLGLKHGREARQRFRDCTESGIWPGYHDDQTAAVIDLPGYAYADKS